MKTTQAKLAGNKMKTNLLLDIGLFILFLVIYEQRATGLTLHEWGGLALATTIIVHILLHWEWVIHWGKRFLKAMSGEIRINYVLNVALFISFTAIVFSGLLISKVVMPLFGLPENENGFWRWLHGMASDVTIWLIGLHVAMHWTWIVSSIKRLMFASSTRREIESPKPVSAAEAE